jgi:hypothetical protein
MAGWRTGRVDVTAPLRRGIPARPDGRASRARPGPPRGFTAPSPHGSGRPRRGRCGWTRRCGSTSRQDSGPEDQSSRRRGRAIDISLPSLPESGTLVRPAGSGLAWSVPARPGPDCGGPAALDGLQATEARRPDSRPLPEADLTRSPVPGPAPRPVASCRQMRASRGALPVRVLAAGGLSHRHHRAAAGPTDPAESPANPARADPAGPVRAGPRWARYGRGRWAGRRHPCGPDGRRSRKRKKISGRPASAGRPLISKGE